MEIESKILALDDQIVTLLVKLRKTSAWLVPQPSLLLHSNPLRWSYRKASQLSSQFWLLLSIGARIPACVIVGVIFVEWWRGAFRKREIIDRVVVDTNEKQTIEA